MSVVRVYQYILIYSLPTSVSQSVICVLRHPSIYALHGVVVPFIWWRPAESAGSHPGLVRVNAQGRSYPNPGTGARSEDWEELGLEVRVGHFAPPPPPVVCIGINCGSPPPPPLPPPPPTCQWFSTLSRPSLQQLCSHAYPEVPSSFHWARRPDASTVRCGASRCSMSDTQCCGVPPPVAPPPPPLQQHCRTSAITEACCGHPGQDCSHGAPAVCSGNCRAEVLQFAALCPEVCSWLRVHKGKLCLRTNAQS
jgi:hypothetical protein